MWRIVLGVLGAALLLTLALGSAAVACPWCGAQTALEGVRIDATDTAQSLVLTVRPLAADLALPDSGTAVVMFFNGNRAKCLNTPLHKAGVDSSGVATYRGDVPAYYGGSRGTLMTYTGRVEIAGDVYEFSVASDGKPGTAKIVADGTTVNAVAATPAATPVTVVTPVPLPTTAASVPTAAAQAAPQASAPEPWTPLRQPMTWLAALAILATIVGAYFDRRRALAKALA